MHVCLNTSFHDSGCLVVLEAMAHGLPIICINAGGPGVLTDTTNAFKVDAFSSEEIVNDLKDSVYRTINEQIQNIAQKKDTLCRRMYN